jgi:hypothetical protein
MPTSRRKTGLWIAIGLILAASAGAVADLHRSQPSSLRRFDPDAVARLETAMWRSYYDRQELPLYRQMCELLRTQYHLPRLRANLVAYQAARGAFVFKRGHARADYERALPYLVNYYRAIRAASDTPFDVQRAARLELEWWIVHRQRESHTPEDLTRALADLQAEIYQLPSDRLMAHARLRAEAMTIRDDRAEQGGVREADWQRIEELLRGSYRELSRAVNA